MSRSDRPQGPQRPGADHGPSVGDDRTHTSDQTVAHLRHLDADLAFGGLHPARAVPVARASCRRHAGVVGAAQERGQFVLHRALQDELGAQPTELAAPIGIGDASRLGTSPRRTDTLTSPRSILVSPLEPSDRPRAQAMTQPAAGPRPLAEATADRMTHNCRRRRESRHDGASGAVTASMHRVRWEDLGGAGMQQLPWKARGWRCISRPQSLSGLWGEPDGRISSQSRLVKIAAEGEPSVR